MPFRILTFLAAFAASMPILGQQVDPVNGDSGAAEPGLRGPVVCVPNASGSGWLCTKDDGQPLPVVEPRVDELDPPVSEDVEATPQTDPLPESKDVSVSSSHAMGEDPAGWYRPIEPRPVQRTHQIHSDLAAAMFVLREDARGGYCSGDYLFREYPHSRDVNNEDYPIVAEADSLSSVIDQDAALTGNVTIEQGNRLIVAPEAELNQNTRVAEFPSGVRMDQPGIIMQGSAATVDLNSDEAELAGVQFLLSEIGMRGEAAQLNQEANGDLLIRKNRFTRCEPGHNGWSLNTSSLLIEEDEVFATARNAVIRMKSVPVFYTPYLKFPVTDDRVSGFLFPTVGYSDEDGVDLSVPYYLNLAPNYDATIIPRYMGERGAGLEAEFRHMSSWQSTSFAAAILPEDDLYNGRLDREDFDEAGGEAALGPFEPADRWLGGVQHSGQLGRFGTLIDYTAVSDTDYFRDLGSDLGVSSRRELERLGQIDYRRGDLYARVWAQRFQRIDQAPAEDYYRLPEIDVRWGTNILGPLRFTLDTSWSAFDRDTNGLNGLAAVTGSRFHAEPRLLLPFERPYGFLRFGAGYRFTQYDLEQDRQAGGFQLMDDTPDRGIGLATVDAGLFFERDLYWFNTALIQTLEPRVYFLWQEFEEQNQLPLFDTSVLTFSYSQLYRDNRFSGLDRVGDAEQLSAGVTTRFVSADSGKEYFRFSVGEIFYLEDRRVGAVGPEARRNSSALASEISGALANNWRLFGNVIWDPYDNEVDEGGGGIQYRRDNKHIFNLGFRNNRREDVEQTDVSLYWPITKSISLLGRWNYDLVSGRTIEGIGGLEFEDCCLKVRLIARRHLDSRPGQFDLSEVKGDDGIFLQIVFKGLAGFGTKVESVLERGIRGYYSPEQRDYFSNY